MTFLGCLRALIIASEGSREKKEESTKFVETHKHHSSYVCSFKMVHNHHLKTNHVNISQGKHAMCQMDLSCVYIYIYRERDVTCNIVRHLKCRYTYTHTHASVRGCNWRWANGVVRKWDRTDLAGFNVFSALSEYTLSL